MRIDHRFLNWGIFFVLLGTVPLLLQAGLVDSDAVARLWQLWPLLIIGGGVGLLLRRTSVHFAGGLIVAATAGLMLGGLLAVGADIAKVGSFCGSDSGKAFAGQQGPLLNGKVNIEFSCGDLAVGTAPGSVWTLTGASHDGTVPRIDTGGGLSIRSRDNAVGFLGFGTRQAWTVGLPQDPTLDVNAQLNAASGRLGFAGAHLGTLEIQGNAGSVTADLSQVAALQRVEMQVNAASAKVALPNASLTGDLEVNAGSIGICVPEGVGLRITTTDNLTSSNNFADQGLTKSGNTWESANFGSATAKALLTTSANAGSITLNPKEGCR